MAFLIPELVLDVTPPEIAQQVYRVVYEITGDSDPYRYAKRQADDLAMSSYPLMKDRVVDRKRQPQFYLNVLLK